MIDHIGREITKMYFPISYSYDLYAKFYFIYRSQNASNKGPCVAHCYDKLIILTSSVLLHCFS